LIVAASGASGAVITATLLKKLKLCNTRVALIVSEGAQKVAEIELKTKPNELEKMADIVIEDEEQLIGLEPKAMIIAPCSMKTLAGVAWERTDNILLRTAKQILHKKIPLILVVRETPWSIIHLKNMLQASKKGAIIMPPSIQPQPSRKKLEDAVDYLADKIVSLCL